MLKVIFRALPFAAAAIAFSGAAGAAETKASCGAATLNGTYIYSYTGSLIVDKMTVPFAVSGQAVYHGDGTVSGISTTTTKKSYHAKPLTYTGTYLVSDNCRVREIDTDETGAATHYDEFTTSTGATIGFVETDPGTISAGSITRQ